MTDHPAPSTDHRRFRFFPEGLNLIFLVLGLATLCSKLAEDRRPDFLVWGEERPDASMQATIEAIERLVTDVAPRGWDHVQTRRSLLFRELEKKHSLAPGTITVTLQKTARTLAARASIPLLSRAKAAYAASDFASAENLASLASARLKKAGSTDSHKLVGALEFAGWSALMRVNNKTARGYFDQALQFTDKAADPLEWARIQNARTHTLDKRSDAPEFAPLLEEVIAIRKKALGAEHPDTLWSRRKHAQMLAFLDRFPEAEKENGEVLAICARVLGADHVETLLARQAWASTLSAVRKYPEAEAQYRAALDAYLRLQGEESRDTLAAWNGYAGYLFFRHRYAESEVERRKVLAIQQRVVGMDNPETWVTWFYLAQVLEFQKRYAEAADEHHRLLAVKERKLGASSHEVAMTTYYLAKCLANDGKNEDAMKAARSALEIFHGKPRSDNVMVKRTEEIIAGLQGKGMK